MINEKDTVTLNIENTPINSKIKLNINNNAPIPFLLVSVSVADDERNDPYISIISDTKENRELITNMGFNIIGSGTTNASLSKLLYGLQHPTRILYKSFITDFCDGDLLKDRYNSDDERLRNLFNNVN